MGVHGRCGGLLLDDAPLEGQVPRHLDLRALGWLLAALLIQLFSLAALPQELFALELNARADSPSGMTDPALPNTSLCFLRLLHARCVSSVISCQQAFRWLRQGC